jgi:hypothetical protein
LFFKRLHYCLEEARGRKAFFCFLALAFVFFSVLWPCFFAFTNCVAGWSPPKTGLFPSSLIPSDKLFAKKQAKVKKIKKTLRYKTMLGFFLGEGVRRGCAEQRINKYLRVIRIELIISTWKVEVIPFNYTRLFLSTLLWGMQEIVEKKKPNANAKKTKNKTNANAKKNNATFASKKATRKTKTKTKKLPLQAKKNKKNKKATRKTKTKTKKNKNKNKTKTKTKTKNKKQITGGLRDLSEG